MLNELHSNHSNDLVAGEVIRFDGDRNWRIYE